jgi:hypothetical protein
MFDWQRGEGASGAGPSHLAGQPAAAAVQPTPVTNEYERLVQANIARNRAFFQDLGIQTTAKSLQRTCAKGTRLLGEETTQREPRAQAPAPPPVERDPYPLRVRKEAAVHKEDTGQKKKKVRASHVAHCTSPPLTCAVRPPPLSSR